MITKRIMVLMMRKSTLSAVADASKSHDRTDNVYLEIFCKTLVNHTGFRFIRTIQTSNPQGQIRNS